MMRGAALRAALAATLRHNMNWPPRRCILDAAAGAAFGSTLPRTVEALDAISLAAAPPAGISVAGAWAIAMSALPGLRERLEEPARS